MDVADNQKLSGESVWYFPVGDSSQDPHVSIARFPSSESTSSSDPKYSPYSSLDSDESFTHRRLSSRKTAIAPRNLSPKRFDNYRWPSTDQPVRTVSRQRSSSVPPSASFGIASVEAEEGLVGDKLTELSSANQPFMDTTDSRMVEDFTLWSDEEQQKSETGYVKVRPTRTRFAPLTNFLCASRGIFLNQKFCVRQNCGLYAEPVSLLTGQFADKPTRCQWSNSLVSSSTMNFLQTGQTTLFVHYLCASMKCTLYNYHLSTQIIFWAIIYCNNFVKNVLLVSEVTSPRLDWLVGELICWWIVCCAWHVIRDSL